MIIALASHFQIPIHKFGPNSMNISTLIGHLTSIQSGLIVLEDIDVLSNTKQRKIKKQDDSAIAQDEDHNSVTLDDLLSVLDGLDTPEDLVIIMTSNYPEVIDDALLRPGRVDLQIQFGPLGIEEVHRVIKKFYPDVPLLSGEIKITPADLQNICRNSETLDKTLETLKRLHPAFNYHPDVRLH